MLNKHKPVESVQISDFVLEEVYGWYCHFKSIENSENGSDREYDYEPDYLDTEFNEMLTYVLERI